MNPLNYNRYTYVLNNPLKYTDPSGYKKLDHYEIQELREEEQAYFRFWTSINEANDLNWVNHGGGRDSRAYAQNLVENVGANPYWHYNENTGEYFNHKSGARIDAGSPGALFDIGAEHENYLIYEAGTSLDGGKTFTGNGKLHIIRQGVMISDGTFSTFSSKENAHDFISETNYWIGLIAAVLSGERGLHGAVENLKEIQKISNQVGNNLDFSKEISRGGKAIKAARLGGIITTGISMAYSYEEYRNGIITQGMLMADIGMAIGANITKVGWVAALSYTIIDIYYPGGIPGFTNDYASQQIEFFNSVGYSTTTIMR